MSREHWKAKLFYYLKQCPSLFSSLQLLSSSSTVQLSQPGQFIPVPVPIDHPSGTNLPFRLPLPSSSTMTTTTSLSVDKILRNRLDAMMVMVRRRGPHFGSPVSDLLRLTEANFEGVEMSEDGVTTIPLRGAKATVVISLVVEQRCCNFSDNAHGGFLAWLIDVCSSMPLVLLQGPVMWQTAGVSSNMNVYYLGGIPMGTEISVISTVIQKGKSTATMEAKVVDSKTGQLYAQGFHTKVDNSGKIKDKIRAHL